MIVLTRLNGETFGINDEQIERLESGHDTTVVLVTGNRYTVLESVDEIIEAVIEFRSRITDRRWTPRSHDSGAPVPLHLHHPAQSVQPVTED